MESCALDADFYKQRIAALIQAKNTWVQAVFPQKQPSMLEVRSNIYFYYSIRTQTKTERFAAVSLKQSVPKGEVANNSIGNEISTTPTY